MYCRRQGTRVDDDESLEGGSPPGSIEGGGGPVVVRSTPVLTPDGPVVLRSVPVLAPRNAEGRPGPAPPEAAGGSQRRARPQATLAPSGAPPRPPAGRPGRRDARDGLRDSADSSVLSDCFVHKNSMSFRRSDSESFYSLSSSSSSASAASSSSSDGSFDSKGSGKEGGRTSNKASLSSNVNVGTKTPVRLFPVAKNDGRDGSDLPPHWEKSVLSAGPSSSTTGVALLSLLRGGRNEGGSSFRSSFLSRGGKDRSRKSRGGESVGSLSVASSGFWSGIVSRCPEDGSGSIDASSLGMLGSESVVSGSSWPWDSLDSRGDGDTEGGAPATKRRRTSCLQRCARAMGTVVVLAALSALAVACIANGEGRDALFGLLPGGDRLAEFKPSFGDGDHQLVFRDLPRGGGAVEIATKDEAPGDDPSSIQRNLRFRDDGGWEGEGGRGFDARGSAAAAREDQERARAFRQENFEAFDEGSEPITAEVEPMYMPA